MTNWLGKPAADLGRAIHTGDLDPVDLTDALLDAIGSHEYGQRIYARTTDARARAEAMAARERAQSGRRLSLLDGVPISWKDLFDTKDVTTEAGTALLKGRVPDADAKVLETATGQGLVCLGKTHMTELAFSGLGLNPVTASPPCIHDHDAVAGGSSSGAATSVAFGLAAAGIGSDTGGSVRIPAVWNDLVGLKTTHGRLSLENVVPLCARFDTVGPICRTVEDAALLLAALEAGPVADIEGASLSGTRLLVLQNVAFDEILDAPRAGFESAVDRFAQAGATITRAEIPEVDDAVALSGVLFATEAYGTWGKEIEAHPDLMYPEVRERFLSGKAYSGAEFVAAWNDLYAYRKAWARYVEAYDAVILPTCPNLPPKIADLEADGAFFVAENLKALRNTRIANLFGLSALTLPTGVPSTGVMLLGGPGTEERLLRLGRAAEAALS